MEKLTHYKLSFYVPESHLEIVKQALFTVGAGRQGNYEQTCWQCMGQGQFKPLAGANPAIGERNVLTYINEYKVEMICAAHCIFAAVQELKSKHPYEEPAYDVVRLEMF
ncbi:NGG1p interacting factor 3 protein, NIF3 [Legionella fairfieldensis]|uniref:NGG1p interacting factor 3 protein, NIF3 n=1 Tax=Legionella fairfieldensis TaxID=45064 RepID=UPI00048AF133|nr:NGG1p interacting factor 3 protein, NIF3 [Legionella fairfieldensis]